jgi:hypothetical protein
MIIVIAAVAVLMLVPLTGGTYSGLLDLRVRGSWIVAAAILVQIAIISVLDIGAGAVSKTLHLATYAAIGACVWLNRKVRWMPVIGVGWLSNFVAILVNGGVMPTSSAAADAIGRHTSTTFENSAPLSDPHLGFLGDIIVTPRQLPLQNVLSIGDVLLLVGFTLVVVAASRTSRSIARQPLDDGRRDLDAVDR